MGHIISVPQYRDIKKSTYDRAYKRFQKNLEGKSFGEIITITLDFHHTYLKVPIYKDSGILAQIRGSEIIEYKYKKRLKTEFAYVCGAKEYECLQEIANKSR